MNLWDPSPTSGISKFPGVVQNSWLAPPAGDWDGLLKIMGSCPILGSRNYPFQDCCGHLLTGAKSILYHLSLFKPMNVPPANGLVTSSKMGAAAESRFEAWVCPMSSNWHFMCEWHLRIWMVKPGVPVESFPSPPIPSIHWPSVTWERPGKSAAGPGRFQILCRASRAKVGWCGRIVWDLLSVYPPSIGVCPKNVDLPQFFFSIVLVGKTSSKPWCGLREPVYQTSPKSPK